jgi:hypothetical protein
VYKFGPQRHETQKKLENGALTGSKLSLWESLISGRFHWHRQRWHIVIVVWTVVHFNIAAFSSFAETTSLQWINESKKELTDFFVSSNGDPYGDNFVKHVDNQV